jgi:hypothetical protein
MVLRNCIAVISLVLWVKNNIDTSIYIYIVYEHYTNRQTNQLKPLLATCFHRITRLFCCPFMNNVTAIALLFFLSSVAV